MFINLRLNCIKVLFIFYFISSRLKFFFFFYLQILAGIWMRVSFHKGSARWNFAGMASGSKTASGASNSPLPQE
jgi:hypothetical protein